MRALPRRMCCAIVLVAAAAVGASAQFGARAPQWRGVWHAVVGSGSAYQMEGKDSRKTEMEIAVVGSETVEGKPGYWLEMAIQSPDAAGSFYMKQLMVLDGKQMAVKRATMQAVGQPPMEMSIGTWPGITQQPADVREQPSASAQK